MAALQYVDRPNYAAILFRRTYADLAKPGALMDRAHSWLGGTAARWKDNEHKYTFPSVAGNPATLSFGHLENEKDKYDHQSAEYQYIGFDEMTQFPASQVTYLFSRLRRTVDSDVPLRFRGASNPGNIGHEFVKLRYVDPGSPDRPFVAAKLADNPHLDAEEYRKSLAELDTETRRQLEEGVWDEPTPEGAYYRQAYEQAEKDGRITHVPHDPMLPVFTFWDLGTSRARDSMTVWFAQPEGFRIRVIRAYGVGGEGFPHMAQHLNKLGYTYAEHWAPHDIQVKEVGSGKTRYETAYNLGIHFRQVPNIGFFEGIQAARLIWPRCYFDKTNCAVGLRALKNYRKEWDDKGQCFKDYPFKDWTNDYADGFRMLAVGFETPREKRKPPRMPPSAMSA